MRAGGHIVDGAFLEDFWGRGLIGFVVVVVALEGFADGLVACPMVRDTDQGARHLRIVVEEDYFRSRSRESFALLKQV